MGLQRSLDISFFYSNQRSRNFKKTGDFSEPFLWFCEGMKPRLQRMVMGGFATRCDEEAWLTAAGTVRATVTIYVAEEDMNVTSAACAVGTSK